MNLNNEKYSQYLLVQEMMDTMDVVKKFDPSVTKETGSEIKKTRRLMMTGEGSSRIFPAHNAIRKSLSWGIDLQVSTEGSRQCAQYDLSKFAVFHASNSGRTKEVVLLAKMLAEKGDAQQELQVKASHHKCYKLTAAASHPKYERVMLRVLIPSFYLVKILNTKGTAFGFYG